MILWLKLTIIWFSIDAVILVVAWYGLTVIRPRYPNWWKRVIADRDPSDY